MRRRYNFAHAESSKRFLNDFVVVDCPECEATVSADVKHCHTYQPDDAEALGIHTALQLAVCPSCGNPLLTSRSLAHYGDDSVEISAQVHREWPISNLDRHLPAESPAAVRFAYDEAQRCLKARAYTASAVMARAALEAIVSDLGGEGRTLAKRIADLGSKDRLDPRLLEWATLVRIVGNDAVHDIDPTRSVSREDATDMVGMVEAFADYLYAFQQRFERLSERRSRDS